MTRCRRCGPPRCRCHNDGWRWLGIVIVFPLWLAVWLGGKIRERWGKTGMWIYVGVWCLAGMLNACSPPAPTPPPPTPPPIVVTVTATPNP